MKTSEKAPAERGTNADTVRYHKTLRRLQVELVKLQSHVINCDQKILVGLEGRDAAGKDGAIKHVIEHLSPRETKLIRSDRSIVVPFDEEMLVAKRLAQ